MQSEPCLVCGASHEDPDVLVKCESRFATGWRRIAVSIEGDAPATKLEKRQVTGFVCGPCVEGVLLRGWPVHKG